MLDLKQGVKLIRNIVYAGIEAGKKHCLCKGLRLSKDCLSRETMQYYAPQGLARSNFFRNDSSKQKGFHLSARELHDECYASISVEIICCENLQQGSYRTVAALK